MINVIYSLRLFGDVERHRKEISLLCVQYTDTFALRKKWFSRRGWELKVGFETRARRDAFNVAWLEHSRARA